jgi:hypothetical protein
MTDEPDDNLDLIDENVPDDCDVDDLSRGDFGAVVECAARRVHPDMTVKVTVDEGYLCRTVLRLGDQHRVFDLWFSTEHATLVGTVRATVRAHARQLVDDVKTRERAERPMLIIGADCPTFETVEEAERLLGKGSPFISRISGYFEPPRTAFHPSQLEPEPTACPARNRHDAPCIDDHRLTTVHRTACGCYWSTSGEMAGMRQPCDTHRGTPTENQKQRAMPPPPPALTLLEVEAIATEAAHKVNPAIRVVVDNVAKQHVANQGAVARLWLTLAGAEVTCVIGRTPGSSVGWVAKGAAEQLCMQFARAWRPEGWREA